MDHKIYNWITVPLIFGIWLYITITLIRAYSRMDRLTKSKRLSPFMSRREINEIKDPEVIKEYKEWKNKTRKLSIIWIITTIAFMIISIIINQTIGFKG